MVGLDHFLARGRAHVLGTRLDEVEDVAHLSELVEERPRHLQVEELRHARREFVQALDAEGGGHARGGAEGIDENGDAKALDVLEEEGDIVAGRTLGDPVGDLGDLQIARDGSGHASELPPLVQMRDELAEVGERHGPRGQTATCQTCAHYILIARLEDAL
jgi:hypothetical protein